MSTDDPKRKENQDLPEDAPVKASSDAPLPSDSAPGVGELSDPSKKPPASGTSEASPGSNEKKDTPDPESGRRARILRWIRRGLLATLLLVFFAFLFYVRETLLPFILAVVIAYIFSPVVNWLSTRNLKGKRIPRWIAVILIYIVLFLNIYIFSVTVVPRFASEFGKLAVETPTLFRKASQVWVPQATDSLNRFVKKLKAPLSDDAPEKNGKDSLPVRPVVEEPAPDEILVRDLESNDAPVNGDDPADPGGDLNPEPERPPHDMARLFRTLEDYTIEVEPQGERNFNLRFHPVTRLQVEGEGRKNVLDTTLEQYLDNMLIYSEQIVRNLIVFGRGVISRVVGSLMTLVLTFMLAAFILIDTPRIMTFFRSLVPPENRSEYDDILKGIDRGLGGVIRGQFIICAVNGTLTGIGLMILGVKYSVILALLATVFSLVPIFGTILSTIPSVGIALTQSLTLGFLTLIWIIIIHLIEANLLNPKIMGTSARIHPALVVFALVAGEHAYGLFGALLAVPVFSIFQTLFLYFRKKAYPE